MSRSSVLFLLPFFILDILGCLEVILLFESACCCCCCCCAVANTETIKKLVSKLDLLFFTGNKDKSGTQKLLCLESAKLFLGYGPQLCFQIWVLEASLSPSFTQYLSIGHFKEIILLLASIFDFQLNFSTVHCPALSTDKK